MKKISEKRKVELLKRRAELLGEVIPKWDKRMEEYEGRNKIEFFKPFVHQARVLEYIHAGKRVVTLAGANGVGKTVLGSVVVGSACLGIQPWDKGPTVWGERPVRVRVLCTDWEKAAGTVIVPKLKEWLPVGQYTTAKNNVGVESMFTFRNGSTIEIITNKQDTSDHEGWEGDLVWADEPFTQDKWVANMRGLRKTVGLFLITMTAVREAWMLDEIVRNAHPSYASVTEIPITANPTLSREYIETFTAALDPKQRIARIEGKWLNLVGLVWSGFNKEVHIVERFDVPTDWPVVVLVDYHPSKEIAIGYYAINPHEEIFVIDEVFKNMSPEMVADDIIRKKTANAWRLKEAFIDPLAKGDMTYIKNRGFTDIPSAFNTLQERLWKHGVDLFVASRDRDSGIRNVEKMLTGPNGRPTLWFFNTLDKIDKEGHLWEIMRWVWDDDNKPKDKDDHFMQLLYQVTLTGTKWTKPMASSDNLTSDLDFNPFAKGYGREAVL